MHWYSWRNELPLCFVGRDENSHQLLLPDSQTVQFLIQLNHRPLQIFTSLTWVSASFPDVWDDWQKMFWAVRQEVKNCLSIHRSDSFVAPSSCKLVVKCLMEIQAGSNFCHRQWDCWRSNLHTRWSKTLVGCNLLGQGLKNTCLRSRRWRKVARFVLFYFHRHELFHGVQARRSRAKRSNTGCDHFDSLYFTLLRRSLATVVRAFCPPLFRCSLSFYCLFPELFCLLVFLPPLSPLGRFSATLSKFLLHSQM